MLDTRPYDGLSSIRFLDTAGHRFEMRFFVNLRDKALLFHKVFVDFCAVTPRCLRLYWFYPAAFLFALVAVSVQRAWRSLWDNLDGLSCQSSEVRPAQRSTFSTFVGEIVQYLDHQHRNKTVTSPDPELVAQRRKRSL